MTLAEARGHATRMASSLRAFVYAEDVLDKAAEAEALIAKAAKTLAKLEADTKAEQDRMGAAKAQADAEAQSCKDAIAKAKANMDAALAGMDAQKVAKRKETDVAIAGYDAKLARVSADHAALLKALTDEEASARHTHAEAMMGLEALKARL